MASSISRTNAKDGQERGKHIGLNKRLQDKLQQLITKSNYLSEELKQANQQLLEVGKRNASLQVNHDKVILEGVEEKKKTET